MEVQDERRNYIRFSTNLKARYFTGETVKNWEECTVFDASRNGMGIKFHTPEEIQIGSTINLETVVSSEIEPLNVRGTLKWIKQEANEFVGGVELTGVSEEIKSLIIMLES
jgi:c-di-GMP-binding flagellar brake protein YcgR